MPGSAIDIKGLTIRTFNNTGTVSTSHDIDVKVVTETLFKVEPGEFSLTKVNTTSKVTYTNTVFNFFLTSTNPVPVGGKIFVVTPPEVMIENVSNVVCKTIKGLNSIGCTVTKVGSTF